MADVTIKYKDNIIAEMSGASTKTLKTAGTYCDGDIIIDYVGGSASVEPNFKIYNLTMAKSSGWILLLTLDSDVLAHINDPSFTVIFKLQEEYEYVYYAGNTYVAGNYVVGYNGNYPAYGTSNRIASTTGYQVNPIYYPANNTGTSTSIGGQGMFRIDTSTGKYYMRPSDGFICPGKYKLVFMW